MCDVVVDEVGKYVCLFCFIVVDEFDVLVFGKFDCEVIRRVVVVLY